MPATTHSAAQQARAALGQRLREIRLEAGLSGRALASLADWHETKVSKIEHARTSPSIEDIRAWCLLCKASQDTADDVVAALHAVEGMWIEWRRMERSGLRRAQESARPMYERAHSFRFYSASVLPGVVQTEAYTTVILRAVARRREVPDDIDDAVAVRMERQRFLRSGNRRFAILLEKSTLRSGIGGPDVWAGQLGHLLSVATLPSVSLGVIPFGVRREAAWPVESFYMFDDAEVNVELVSGYLTVTQPREIELYAQAFTELSALAVHGANARALLTDAIEAAAGEHTQAS
jgi:transcriptional regulator with XRE-family HTH domain